jgi:membrane protein DedA with SNARE-associated domain
MDSSLPLSGLLSFIQSNGYFIIFILLLIEGPTVTYVASFAAALGYFNVWIIFLLSFLGSLIPSIIIYRIGVILRGKTVEKFVGYLGLHKKRRIWLEKKLKRHFVKTYVTAKVMPILPVSAVLITGFMRVPFKKFFWVNFAVDFSYSLIFVVLGFYSGVVVNSSLKYFKLTEFLLPVIVVLTIAIYFVINSIYKKASRRFNSGN